MAIVVEGPTEEEFVKEALAHTLWKSDIYVYPVLIGRARRRVRGGGNVTVDRLAGEMRHLRKNYNAVTSLVDFYGFADKGDLSPDELVQAIRQRIGDSDDGSVFPYVQVHEFEGLLFSDVDAIKRVFRNAEVEQLRSVRECFQTPEDINDSSATAPSRRIRRHVPGYRKALGGPLVALEIGLTQIRSECPRFDAWVQDIESLGG